MKLSILFTIRNPSIRVPRKLRRRQKLDRAWVPASFVPRRFGLRVQKPWLRRNGALRATEPPGRNSLFYAFRVPRVRPGRFVLRFRAVSLLVLGKQVVRTAIFQPARGANQPDHFGAAQLQPMLLAECVQLLQVSTGHVWSSRVGLPVLSKGSDLRRGRHAVVFGGSRVRGSPRLLSVVSAATMTEPLRVVVGRSVARHGRLTVIIAM